MDKPGEKYIGVSQPQSYRSHLLPIHPGYTLKAHPLGFPEGKEYLVKYSSLTLVQQGFQDE